MNPAEMLFPTPKPSMDQISDIQPADSVSNAENISTDGGSRTTNGSTNGNPKRERSPVKKRPDLKLLDIPVTYFNIDDPHHSLPGNMRPLYQDLSTIGEGVKIIPESMRVSKNFSSMPRILTDISFRNQSSRRRPGPYNRICL